MNEPRVNAVVMPPRSYFTCYVYIARGMRTGPRPLTKIGITGCVKFRMRELGAKEKMSWLRPDDAILIEWIGKQLMHRHQVIGEWYDLPVKHALEVVNLAIAMSEARACAIFRSKGFPPEFKHSWRGPVPSMYEDEVRDMHRRAREFWLGKRNTAPGAVTGRRRKASE